MNILTESFVLIRLGLTLATLTPRLPLRARPEIFAKGGLAIRAGIDCNDVVACKQRGGSSRGLEGAVLMVLILEAKLRAGILGGSLSSPGRMHGCCCSFPFSNDRRRLEGHGSMSESSATEGSYPELKLTSRLRVTTCEARRSKSRDLDCWITGTGIVRSVLVLFGRVLVLGISCLARESTEIDLRRHGGAGRYICEAARVGSTGDEDRAVVKEF